MSWMLEVADDAAAATWTDVSAAIDRSTTRFGGEIGNGAAGTGFGADFADDAAAFVFPARRCVRFTIGSTVAARGRIGAKDLSRGLMPRGDARQFALNITDGNAHFQGIPVHGWVRPAETDVARMTALAAEFLAGSPRASTNLATTYLSTDNPIDLEEKTYDSTNPAGVVAELVRLAGKICFITVDDEIFYDREDSSAYAAAIAVSDSSPDEVSTFAPEWIGVAANQDGSDLYSGLGLVYGNPAITIYGDDPTAEAAHDYWHEIVNSSAVTAEQAQTELDNLLLARKVEEDRYHFAVQLREDQDPASLIKYGQLISFRAAAAGVLSPITIRIRRLVWEERGPGVWLARVEDAKLSPRLARGQQLAIPGGSLPQPFSPATPVPDQSLTQFIQADIPDSPYYVRLDIIGTPLTFNWPNLSDSISLVTNVPIIPSYPIIAGAFGPDINSSLWYAFAGPTSRVRVVGFIETNGSTPAVPNLRVRQGLWDAATVDYNLDVGAGRMYGGNLDGSGVRGTVMYDGPMTMGALPYFTGGGKKRWRVDLDLTNFAAVEQIVLETDDTNLFFVNVVPATTDVGGGSSFYRPPVGAPVPVAYLATADGVTLDYQTLFPYQPGSLRVMVDGLDWSQVVAETDPSTGAFHFYIPPSSDEGGDEIWVTYVAA